MLSKPQGYTQEAIDAFREELARRGSPIPDPCPEYLKSSTDPTAGSHGSGIVGYVLGGMALLIVLGLFMAPPKQSSSHEKLETLERSGMALERMKAEWDAEKNGRKVFFSQTCQSCGKAVDPGYKVGDTCPHCGVRWSKGSFETRTIGE